MKDRSSDKLKLLVIGLQWPQPKATAAGQRMMQLLKKFLETGYSVTFASVASDGPYDAPLQDLGIHTRRIRLNHHSFDDFVKNEGFHTALFDRFITEEQFSWRIRSQLPECLLVLDTEDLHSLRHSREVAVKKNCLWQVSDWTGDPLFYREMASILRSDLSLIISRAEMNLLHQELYVLEGKLIYLPFRMEKPQAYKIMPFKERSGFVFVGNGKHAPNLDAIKLLKNEIWPLLSKKLPGATIQIYGAYLPDSVRKMHKPEEGFQVLGWTADLESVLQRSRLQVAPLRYGAGVKGKILNAVGNGLPTLTTKIGMEGILGQTGEESFIAESTEEFTDKALILYQDRALWEKALQSQQRGEPSDFETGFEKLSGFLSGKDAERMALSRETKVIQKLLRDKAFDSVRYLSKWIEAKEEKKI